MDLFDGRAPFHAIWQGGKLIERAQGTESSPSSGAQNSVKTFGLLPVLKQVLDPATRSVTRGAEPITLTNREFALLEYLMRNPNRLITREMAENHIWSYDFQNTSNVVDVYIRRLRRKIDDPFDVKLFETVRGSGYRLRATDASGIKR